MTIIAAAPQKTTRMIALIFGAGSYLFAMVWLYAQVPWLAVVGAIVAMSIVIFGIVRDLRGDPPPPDA